MRFVKGHGTGNDFVILPDPDGDLDLTAGLVARVCDRHFGVGADGVLRVVRAAAAGEDAAGQQAEWFMDYRNADGSMAEMCGNGVRVFAKYLIEQGMAAGPELAIATRAGTRTVCAEPDGQFTVDMGAATVLDEGEAEAGGQRLAGLAISVGNPHLACIVTQPVTAIDLDSPRVLRPAALTTGANIEVIRVLRDRELEMRVHERGSGLTLSCGTGAVAAAVAAAAWAGEWPSDSAMPWTVRVPGGKLAVTPSVTASLLTGPAEIVASGELAARWLADHADLADLADRPG
ncbi:MAG TPA: diaminopimelate epimerase [Streptosporangiaceae bacterium]|jgi:diaminopimelate epimerase|nr:diaminopimelate epimerase [Streptosporangiaceae bacterium]